MNYYALIDDVQPAAGENSTLWVRLDAAECVGIESLSELYGPGLNKHMATLSTCFFEVKTRILPIDTTRWVMITDDIPRGIPAIRYPATYPSDGVETSISIQYVSPLLSRQLTHQFRLSDPDATDQELMSPLSTIGIPKEFRCINVGQGHCSSLAASSKQPADLYIDFGLAFGGNARTAPTAVHFCTAHQPPVILSHWDVDHYHGAHKSPDITRSTWIVPRQTPLGPTARKLAATISLNGTLLIWPSSHRVKKLSPWIFVSKGYGRSRNDSGLIVRSTVAGRRILFPGDARYASVVWPLNANNDILVVSHHGGSVLDRVPAPRTLVGSCAVLSYGKGNTYGHPHPATIQQLTQLWSQTVKTHGGTVGFSSAAVAICGCGNPTCSLQIVQQV